MHSANLIARHSKQKCDKATEDVPPSRGRSAGWQARQRRQCQWRRSAETDWVVVADQTSGRPLARRLRCILQKTGRPTAQGNHTVSPLPYFTKLCSNQACACIKIELVTRVRTRFMYSGNDNVACAPVKVSCVNVKGGTAVAEVTHSPTQQGFFQAVSLCGGCKTAVEKSTSLPMRTARTPAAVPTRSQVAAPTVRQPPCSNPGPPRHAPLLAQPESSAGAVPAFWASASTVPVW